MPPVTKLLDEKITLKGGFILQLRLWLVPSPVRASRHSLKYSLFFGRPGERIVAYDNEAGKGDHRHYGGREEPYPFDGDPDKLIADFRADVERWRKNYEREG